MKRLVAISRWRDSWFMELHPYAKLLLSYIYDNCDICGAIDYNQNLWLTQIQGEVKDKKRYSQFTKQDLLHALEDLKPKLLSDKKKKLFIKDFLLHQNKLPLIRGNEEHELIILKLQSNLNKFNDAKEIKDILDKVVEPKKEEEETPKKKSKASNKFIAPEFDEFKEYYLSEKPEADEENDIRNLYDHYLKVGWRVGGNGGKPMKDWQAAIRNSIRRNEKYKTSSGENKTVKKTRSEVTLNVVNDLKKQS